MLVFGILALGLVTCEDKGEYELVRVDPFFETSAEGWDPFFFFYSAAVIKTISTPPISLIFLLDLSFMIGGQ